MISSISSLEIIKVVNTDPDIFLWIVASVADAVAVNPNGIKTLLANGLSTFLIKGNLVFNNSLKSLLNNPCGCPILCNWVFDNFILAAEFYVKALRSRETCVLINDNLWGKLFSSLESAIIIDERFKVTSVPFFVTGFNLLSCELDNFAINVFYWVVSMLILYYDKNKIIILQLFFLKNLRLFCFFNNEKQCSTFCSI